MAGIYSQGGSAGHRYAGWLSEVDAKNFTFGGKVFNGSPSAIYVGSKMVWMGGWLSQAAQQAIRGAFGQTDGMAVINATNAYLNQLAASDRDKANALAGFINDGHPYDALISMYNQDGLVFQMDRAYGLSAVKWTDLIGDTEFVGTNVQIIDDVPYFNGSANYNKSAFLFPFDSTTIEIVYNRDNNSDSIMFLDGSANGQAVGIYQGSYIIGESSYRTMASMATQYGELVTFSTAKDLSVENERVAVRSGSNYWTPYGTATIGGRLNNGSFTYQFKGKIYGIRIYNRLLTKAEILANQDIDLKRFTPSTP